MNSGPRFMPSLSSLAIRQALATAAIVVVAVVLFGWIALTAVDRSLHADLLHTIDTDVAGLVDVAAGGGAPELARRIGDRTAVTAPDAARAWYLLLGPDGRRLGGDLPVKPDLDPRRSSTGTVHAGGGDVLLRATRLAGGVDLFVGRSLGPAQALEAQLTRALLIAALAVVIAALVVGLVAAWRLEARVSAVNAVFRRFEQGDLAARVDPHIDPRVDSLRSADEVATLGRHIDRHLDRIGTLIVAQREISDNIAHELRTPLTHLDARLRRALEQAEGRAIAPELDAARADVRSIVSLFEALLDIAIGESGGASTQQPIDLSLLAADLGDLYAASAEEAGLALILDIAPGVHMQGQPMQISRLISNLLDNAIKFVPAGCHIRLRVAAGPVIVVEDDGHGVPEGDRDRIFHRFGRSHPNAAGHGLGLALVKVIAARHGLAVRLEDAAPGARFVIESKG